VRSSSKLKLFALALAGLFPIGSALAADLDVRPHHKRYRHVASLEQVVYTPGDCRIGWWQTVREGHVRPRWAMRCR